MDTETQEWLNKIEREMARRGMRHAMLARLTEINQSAISRWFHGESEPSARSRLTVERALGLAGPPAREGPDDLLQRSLFGHPDLTDEQAAHFWNSIRLTLQENRRQRKDQGRLATLHKRLGALERKQSE